jgi:hypothetical protein
VPEHIAGAVKLPFILGVGLTVTVIDCVLLQPLTLIVILYVTVTGNAVVFVSISLIVLPVPLVADSEMPVAAKRSQLKLALNVELVAVYVNNAPEHIADGVGEFNTGVGLTTTFTV